MAHSLKWILLLFALPCLTILGFEVKDWVYLVEVSGRYLVLGSLALVIFLLYALRNVKLRYVILAIFLCLMCVKSDHYIRNWEKGYGMVQGWLEANPPEIEDYTVPPMLYFNAQLVNNRILLWSRMLNYYWGELREDYYDND